MSVIPIGTILLAMANMIAPGFMPAEGQCLKTLEYPELADVLHDGDNWPYGLCDGGFKIPDLRSKDTEDSERYHHKWFIKVKP